MRVKFEMQLKLLNEELVRMGSLVESAIANAVKAFTLRDKSLAEKAISFEDDIDQTERDIENLCLKLLLQQQPVAKDLNAISGALKMITDMERIGDMASDISEIALMNLNSERMKDIIHIPQMAAATIGMVKDSIDAYLKKDTEAAKKVIADDDTVDALFDTVKNDLILYIRENADQSSAMLDVLMVAKYFERIGDHATNIAEWVIFSITGKHPDK